MEVVYEGFIAFLCAAAIYLVALVVSNSIKKKRDE